MWIHMTLAWILVSMYAPMTATQRGTADPWSRIRTLMEEGTAQGNPKLVEYLQSLTAEQMLLGAKQASEEVARNSAEMRDMPPSEVAKIYVTVCLRYYFDKTGTEDGAKVIVQIISDRAESPFLRQALISRMRSTEEPFDRELQTYAISGKANVPTLLTGMLESDEEHQLVRKEAMYYLAVRLGEQVGKIIRSDPNVHAIWERTHTVVPVGTLVRSGELTLTDATMKALEPIQARTRAFVQVLGAIVGDKNG